MPAATDSTYFIGQGSVKWAPRQTNGAIIGGFTPFGDVSSLQIDHAQKFVDIEENLTGFGGTALHASVSIPVSMKMTVTQWKQDNLAKAIYGAWGGAQAGGTVTSESTIAYAGQGQYLANMGASALTLATAAGIVSNVTFTVGVGYATAPTVAFTAAPAGGTTATGYATIANGAVNGIFLTNPGEGYTVAPTITLTGGGFTTAATATADITAKTLVEGTDYTFNPQFGEYTTLVGGASFFSAIYPPSTPVPLTANYTWAANNGTVGALLVAPQELCLMFDGLNVANPQAAGGIGTFAGMRIKLNRVSMNISKMLDLIGRKESNFELDGMILLDSTVATAGLSQYYSITKA